MQRLNTSTHECETIKLLTFAPRCLVAANGWLCCGSENGDFVAIHLEDDGDGHNPNAPLNLDPDARLPINIDSSREESLYSLITQATRSNKSLIAKSMKLANDRVNCITLWFPNATVDAADCAYSEPVAVLANNDRTVTLVSLRDFDHKDTIEPLEVVRYPDYVNRAIISPDGRTLVAILDDPYLYVHERVDKVVEPGMPAAYQWVQRRRLLLKSQRKDDKSDSRGSFAACFSSSGSYLAIGTQHGTVSVFNTTHLTDVNSDPLITTFRSSRPESGPGAIRDMAFCPGPYDILAWTEDRGRIGLVDIRMNFIIRQIVDINNEADFEHINIFDRNTIDPRLLDGQGFRRDNGQPSNTGRRENLNAARRDDAADLVNHPLTPSETRVLEAIQGDRRRRERLSQRGENPDTAGPSPDLSWAYLTSLRSSAGNDGESSRPRERSSSVGRAIGETLGSYQPRDRERDRVQDRVRNLRQLARETTDRQASVRRDQRWIDRLGETVTAMREQRDRDADGRDSSVVNVLDILQANQRASGSGGGGGGNEHEESSVLVPLVNQVVNRWEESAIRGTLAVDHGVFEVPPSPDNTAGLAWSDDGHTL